MINKVENLKPGAIISESSHYILKNIIGTNAVLTHYESNEEIQIGTSYLKNYTHSGDLYDTEVKVTKETTRMEIYTQEELEAFDEEYEDEDYLDDEEIDYDDYDEYYDE